MDQAGIVTLIDEALERFATRDLIGSSEVVDFLLDLRSAVVSDADARGTDRIRDRARPLTASRPAAPAALPTESPSSFRRPWNLTKRTRTTSPPPSTGPRDSRNGVGSWRRRRGRASVAVVVDRGRCGRHVRRGRDLATASARAGRAAPTVPPAPTLEPSQADDHHGRSDHDHHDSRASSSPPTRRSRTRAAASEKAAGQPTSWRTKPGSKALHFDPGPVDGYFDQDMQYAVTTVQKSTASRAPA